jgi:hypothetical protein
MTTTTISAIPQIITRSVSAKVAAATNTTTPTPIDYSTFSNKEIILFDKEQVLNYYEYWVNFRNLQDIPLIGFHQIPCMTPGNIAMVRLVGEQSQQSFLLQKYTGGALKQIIKDWRIIQQLMIMNNFKYITVADRFNIPILYDLSIEKFYIYAKNRQNDTLYTKEYLGNGFKYLENTRNILTNGNIEHHEYLLIFHNTNYHPLCNCHNLLGIIHTFSITAYQHDIPKRVASVVAKTEQLIKPMGKNIVMDYTFHDDIFYVFVIYLLLMTFVLGITLLLF